MSVLSPVHQSWRRTVLKVLGIGLAVLTVPSAMFYGFVYTLWGISQAWPWVLAHLPLMQQAPLPWLGWFLILPVAFLFLTFLTFGRSRILFWLAIVLNFWGFLSAYTFWLPMIIPAFVLSLFVRVDLAGPQESVPTPRTASSGLHLHPQDGAYDVMMALYKAGKGFHP